MNKFFLFFLPFLLLAVPIRFPYTVKLKKDELFKMDVYYLNRVYPFEMRRTLFINDVITVLYKYDNFPRQVELQKKFSQDAFKVPVALIPENYPYFYIKFDDFNGKIATFTIYLFNGKKVRANLKE
ncbi:conserved hypothetical protein [Lebetimonas natsushimae]|uniref:Uncharacterized protein n=1 Tax=Lebetimonas natsushimae TaxID=1936991 RepID=A0A292YE38_9BACT|nr:hypothetical protein [Lebetimonas natsushimae]GAX87470.1 conserved hypothetical protein [Lebetimonas natsushimae]